MLKFIRKYQMVVLVIGGSLLMVVFLLQPVLTRLAPNPGKKKIATIGPGDTKVTMGEYFDADFEFDAVSRIAPLIVSPQMLGIDAKKSGEHWMLLTREAERNGFVGEGGDGRSWIPELARQQAILAVQQDLYQRFGGNAQIVRFMMGQSQTQEQIGQLTAVFDSQMNAMVEQVGRSSYKRTPDDVERALSHARGIQRMIQRYRSAARVSTRRAVTTAAEQLDAVAVDALILPPVVVLDEIAEPSEDELQAHFERFLGNQPGGGDLGVGYTLAARVRLEFLVLDPAVIGAAATIDRVEMNKLWRQDRVKYPGEFADEAANVERDLRAKLASDAMHEADTAIKGASFNALRGIERDEAGVYDLPDDWAGRRPSLSQVAGEIVETVRSAMGFEIPLPAIVREDRRWLSSAELAKLPHAGQAGFRVGSRQVPFAGLPRLVYELNAETTLPIQTGLLMVDLAATTAAGSEGPRIYLRVLDARNESRAESIDEVGRDRVVNDLRQVRAYERLVAGREDYLRQAREGGLDAMAEVLLPGEEGQPSDLRVQNNMLIRSVVIPGEAPPAAGLAGDEVRAQVLAAARERLGADEPPGNITADRAYMAIDLPGMRSVAIVKLVARRPLTTETYSARSGYVVARLQTDELTGLDSFRDDYPFTYEALARRHNFKPIKGAREEDEFGSDDEGDEAEPEIPVVPGG